MRRQTLEQLVRERVLIVAADKLHLTTSDERLQRLFATDPQFAMLRNADGSVNKELLRRKACRRSVRAATAPGADAAPGAAAA